MSDIDNNISKLIHAADDLVAYFDRIYGRGHHQYIEKLRYALEEIEPLEKDDG